MDPKNLAEFDQARADLTALGGAVIATAGVQQAVKNFAAQLASEPAVRALLAGGLAAGTAAAGAANPALGAIVGALGPSLLSELEATVAGWKASS